MKLTVSGWALRTKPTAVPFEAFLKKPKKRRGQQHVIHRFPKNSRKCAVCGISIYDINEGLK
jgi:hypothetical protein